MIQRRLQNRDKNKNKLTPKEVCRVCNFGQPSYKIIKHVYDATNETLAREYVCNNCDARYDETVPLKNVMARKLGVI